MRGRGLWILSMVIFVGLGYGLLLFPRPPMKSTTATRSLNSLNPIKTKQDWSEMELAKKASEERIAREAEIQRLQELSVRAQADLGARPNEPEQEVTYSPAGSYGQVVDTGIDGPNRYYIPGTRFHWSAEVERHRPLFEQYGWEVPRMMHICQHESGGDPTNHPDGSYAYLGLLQIGDLDPPGYYYNNCPWYEPWWNISAGYEHWLSMGYVPWAGTDYN